MNMNAIVKQTKADEHPVSSLSLGSALPLYSKMFVCSLVQSSRLIENLQIATSSCAR